MSKFTKTAKEPDFRCLPDLIELGLDVNDSLQPGVMDLNEVAGQFGGKIAFQGAIDEQHLLTQGAPQQIKDEAIMPIDLLKTLLGNAFVVAHAKMLTPDIPFEKFTALFEACHAQ